LLAKKRKVFLSFFLSFFLFQTNFQQLEEDEEGIEKQTTRDKYIYIGVCVCMCMREREKHG